MPEVAPSDTYTSSMKNASDAKVIFTLPLAVILVVHSVHWFGISVNGGNIQVDGIKAGYTVTCTSVAGVQLYTAEARSGSLNFQVPAGTGMAIISVSGEGKTHRSKIIIK